MCYCTATLNTLGCSNLKGKGIARTHNPGIENHLFYRLKNIPELHTKFRILYTYKISSQGVTIRMINLLGLILLAG